MDTTAELEISRHLQAGESLVWAGVPEQGLVFRPSEVFLIPFSLLWCGFAIFWFMAALSSGAPLMFAAFGIPFVIAGLYFVFGRFAVDAKLRSNTFYGLTDRRILIVSGIFSRATTTLPLRTLNDITLRERADRSGTVTFGRSVPFGGRFAGMPGAGMGQSLAPAFELIPDVKTVHDRILEAQRAAQ